MEPRRPETTSPDKQNARAGCERGHHPTRIPRATRRVGQRAIAGGSSRNCASGCSRRCAAPAVPDRRAARGALARGHGDPIGVANQALPGQPELLDLGLEQLGAHLFLVVRNVGTSTGGFTLAVTRVPTATSAGDAHEPAAAPPVLWRAD
jgi:hypothetical protein